MAPTPVLLPGKSHERRSLVGCGPWGCEESDTTERLHFRFPPLKGMHVYRGESQRNGFLNVPLHELSRGGKVSQLVLLGEGLDPGASHSLATGDELHILLL